jgi:hypothetical protein
MRERCQISGSAHRTLGGNYRMNAAIEHRAQGFNYHRPHAGETLRESVGAQGEHRPGFVFAEWDADAAGVAAH